LPELKIVLDSGNPCNGTNAASVSEETELKEFLEPLVEPREFRPTADERTLIMFIRDTLEGRRHHDEINKWGNRLRCTQ